MLQTNCLLCFYYVLHTIVYHSELWCDFALLRNLVKFHTTSETDAVGTLNAYRAKKILYLQKKKVEGA